MVERRPHKFKRCVYPGCDWKLVTSWFVGGPHTTVPVSDKVQELNMTTHLVTVHGHSGAPAKIFT